MYYSALGGYAYDDRNYNDVQDLGIPLTGTKVSLYRVIDNVREEQPIATAVVDENGEYLFEYLLEGEYQVLFEYPEGYQAVLPNIGGDDALDSDVFETAPDLNSGYTRPSACRPTLSASIMTAAPDCTVRSAIMCGWMLTRMEFKTRARSRCRM